MIKYSINDLKGQFKVMGYEWPKFHIVGVRSHANAKNQFDDLIAVIDGNRITWYTCTTNPGTYWLKRLANPKGTAVLKPGQYIDGFRIGLHQNKYTALVQNKPVTVYRDRDRDDIAEEQGLVETGFFGINIHRAATSFIAKLIDRWSAGCQVLNNPADFTDLMSKCKGSKKSAFTYTLLREF